MGPNGAGKSTLVKTIAGDDNFKIQSGEIYYQEQLINDTPIDERANRGIFLSYQNPIEIPGVNNSYFLKTAMNKKREFLGQDTIDAADFLKQAKEVIQYLEWDSAILKRSLNEGFSGGEKKRNEIFQMMMLKPTLMLLDEIDSGLDVDALRIVAKGINALKNPQTSMLIITHYKRLLDYIKPDFVHILVDGHIIKSGDAQLAKEIEAHGYAALIGEMS
jgi:Fe-S cluster assembly ATP-binding protein